MTRTTLTRHLVGLGLSALLTACGGGDEPAVQVATPMSAQRPAADALATPLAATAPAPAPAVAAPAYGAPAAAPAPAYGAAAPAAAPAPAAPPTPAAPIGAQTLAFPDDLQMVMLSYRLTGRQPPVERWAAENPQVKGADEFSRAAALQEETARLQSVYDSTADVGMLTLNTNSQFSEYDGGRGGYYLTALSPGTVFTFHAQGLPPNHPAVTLQVDNAMAAQFWAMPPEEAKALLEKISTRQVDLTLNIALRGAEQRSAGTVLRGVITDFTISGGPYNREEQLARITVP